MPAITAKPITATPITARPLTAYGLGESTEGANPLVWHALAANSSGVITDQIKGAGTPTWAHTSSLLLPDYQGVYRTIGSGEAPIVGARWVDGVPYATDELGDPLTDWWFQCQPSYTNSATYSNDLTNAVWTASNVTVAKDAVGLDGAPNTACTLTATAGNGTVIRDAITAASGGHTTQWHIKRKTGTGTIEMTVDGGSTYTDITSQINGSTWARVQVTQAAVTNPSVGFRIGTSGDAIYVDYFGLESASFASSRIHTTTAAVTRNAGSGSYASSSNITTANGVMVLEWTPPYTGMGTVALWGSYVDASNYTRIFHDGANIVFRRRVSGVNYDATKALTYAAGTTYKIAARISNATGGDVFIAGVKGTNSPNTSALQLGANFSVGHDGNGANHSFAPIRNVKHYDTALTDEQVAAL